MAVTEKQAITIDELLSDINNKKTAKKVEKTENEVKSAKRVSKNFPFGMILFVLLIAALGIMVIMLKNEVVLLKTEVADLKNLKEEEKHGRYLGSVSEPAPWRGSDSPALRWVPGRELAGHRTEPGDGGGIRHESSGAVRVPGDPVRKGGGVNQ